MDRTLVIQFCAVLTIAGGTVWLGEVWRNEGKTFFQEKEKQGGIDKARLVLEAEKKKAEIIEEYEAEAREIRGLIEGGAIAASEVAKARGGRDRQKTENLGTSANAYAMETIGGIQTIADRIAASNIDASTARTIGLYFKRAAEVQTALTRLSWAPQFDCEWGKKKAVMIAAGLEFAP